MSKKGTKAAAPATTKRLAEFDGVAALLGDHVRRDQVRHELEHGFAGTAVVSLECWFAKHLGFTTPHENHEVAYFDYNHTIRVYGRNDPTPRKHRSELKMPKSLHVVELTYFRGDDTEYYVTSDAELAAELQRLDRAAAVIHDEMALLLKR